MERNKKYMVLRIFTFCQIKPLKVVIKDMKGNFDLLFVSIYTLRSKEFEYFYFTRLH